MENITWMRWPLAPDKTFQTVYESLREELGITRYVYEPTDQPRRCVFIVEYTADVTRHDAERKIKEAFERKGVKFDS